MALSIFTESAAPRDFRVSTTESDGHYKKCLLCYTVKKNFYCPDCIRTGNFVHSSMPYADRFSEKQAKLLRIKANRKHVLERCEKLLAPKIKRDSLLTEAKQSRDKIDLLRLAIEQRRNNINDKRRELAELTSYNNELRLKLPRYQKRVATLGKHAQNQRIELQNKISTFNDQAQSLAALRRSRIRQLTMYIFPVYMTYDSSDSIEDLEFVGDDIEEEPPKQAQFHIVAPWLDADGDFSQVQAWAALGADIGAALPTSSPVVRCAAALALCAQLVALLAYTLDVRLPNTLAINELCNWRICASGLVWRWRRLCSAICAVCARAAQSAHCDRVSCTQHHPPRLHEPCERALTAAGAGAGAGTQCGVARPLHALLALTHAARADCAQLGRVEPWLSRSAGLAWALWEADMMTSPHARHHHHHHTDTDTPHDDEPPEHLHWPEPNEMEELSCTPPAAVSASLMTSAAASIAHMWTRWTK